MYDPSSSANFNEVTIDHLSLDWTIDFCKFQILGSVVLSIRIIKPTDRIVLIFLLYLKKNFFIKSILSFIRISSYFRKGI